MNNTDKYHALRAQFPVFEYLDYHWKVEDEGLRLWFDFRMGDVEFHPTALVERRPFLDFTVDGIDDIVFNIGMVELVSYWKCACPPTVNVLCSSLDEGQVAFWRKLYWHGLGEFFYTNGIAVTPDAFMRVECEKRNSGRDAVQPAPATFSTSHMPHTASYLVPVGGGKDSVVTLELLRRAGKSIRPLIMNPRGATQGCARVAGFAMDEVLVIRRTIDPTLLELNKQGYLNGHTPFSAMLAFYTMLASRLSGIPNVALSNESSANEPTVLVCGNGTNGNVLTDVNHQYSKSLEFEDDFRSYVGGSFNYFSFLRPLSELQIAMLFSRFTPYHAVFRSCNAGSKQDIWCGRCAKCLFAYIILSPFIEPERMETIFGKAILDDLALEHEFRQLLGLEATKPFECVGTVGEVQTALSMTVERWYAVGPRPALLKDFEPVEPARRVPLRGLLPEGNLTDEERNILLQCIEKIS